MTADALGDHLAQGFQLEIEAPEDGWLSAEPIIGGKALTEAGEQTSRQLNSTVQGVANSGVGGGAAAVGAVIGSALVANLSRSSIEREARAAAQRRVEPLDQALVGHDWAEYYQQAFTQALREQGHTPVLAADLRLRIAPRLRFNEDLRVPRLVSEVRLTQGKNTLYAGRIEFFGEPIDCEECLGLWQAQKAARLLATASAGVADSTALLVSDWQTGGFSSITGPEQTLRFQLGPVRHVERGRLLALGTPRTVFLNLHGWLKSMPVAAKEH